MNYYQWQDEDLILKIRVQPGSCKQGFTEVLGDRVKLCINAPPVDGKANLAVIQYLAGYFGVARRDIEIISGETSREKRVKIHAPSRDKQGPFSHHD